MSFKIFDDGGLSFNDIPFAFSFYQHQPSPNSISIPDLKLAAKLLLKKDQKTKLKSINNLVTYFQSISSNDELDYHFIAFFIQAYPKLAINNDKFVRVSAHKLSSTLFKVYGKKIAIYLKSIVPIWLLGLFDSDKLVVLETKKSFLNCFNEEKQKNLFVIFQTEILTMIETFFSYENVKTLSDNSIVDQDEANLCYFRTFSILIQILTHFINHRMLLDKNRIIFTRILNQSIIFNEISANADDYNHILLLKSILTFINCCFDNDLILNSSTIFKQLFKLLKIIPNHKTYFISVSGLVLKTLANLNNLLTLKDENLIKFKKILQAFLKSTPVNAYSIDYLQMVYAKIPNFIDYTSSDDFQNFLVQPILNQVLSNQHKRFIDENFEKFYEYNDDNSKLKLLNSIKKVYKITSFDQFSYLIFKLNTDHQDAILDMVDKQLYTELIHKYVSLLTQLKDKDLATKHFEEVIKRVDRQENPDLYLSLVNSVIEIDCSKLLSSLTLLEDYFDSSTEVFLKNNKFSLILDILLSVDRNCSKFSFKKSIINQFVEIIKLVDDDEKLTKQFENFLLKFPNNEKIKDDEIDSFILKIINKNNSNPESCKKSLNSLLKITFKMGTTKTWVFIYSNICELLDSSYQKNFWNIFLKYNENDFIINFLEFNKIGFLNLEWFNFFWKTINDSTTKKIFTILEKNLNNEEVFKIYFSSLIDYLKSYSNKAELLSHFEESLSNDKIASLLLPSYEVLIEIMDCFYSSDLIHLTLTENSLNGYFNILIKNYLPKDLTNAFSNVYQIIDLLDISIEFLNDDMQLIGFGVVTEFLKDSYEDYNNDELTIENLKLKEISLIKLFTIDEKVLEKLSSRLDIKTPIEIFKSENDLLSLMNDKIDNTDNLEKFYLGKLYQKLLNEYTKQHLTIDESNNDLWTVFNKSIIRSGNWFKLFCHLPNLVNWFNNQDLENVLKSLISEILMLRQINSQNCLQFYYCLISIVELLNNYNSKLPVLQLSRLVKNFKNYFDSDIFYDEKFLIVRKALVDLLSKLLEFSEFEEVSIELFDDCLGTLINSSIDKENFENELELYFNLELNHSLLKIYLELIKLEHFDKNEDSVIQLFVYYLKNSNIKNNQFKKRMIKLYGKLIKNVNIEQLIPFKDDLVNQLNDNSIETKKLLSYLLGEILPLLKKEQIFNFALNKDKTPSLKIPSLLIKNIREAPSEHVEYESLIITYNYGLTWSIVFKMFYEGLPQKFQSSLSDSLPKNSLETLLNYISQQIDYTYDGEIDYDFTDDEINLKNINNLLISLLFNIILKFKNVIQNWFLTLRNKQIRSTIENFVTRKLSPPIIEKVFDQINKDLSNIPQNEFHSIKFNKLNYEIKSQYFIDEQSTELVLKIPKNYPLSNISIEAPQRLGVKEQTWQSWLLACQNLINNKDQSILEVIELFDKNINLHFKGFEECAICYYILNNQDKSLPTKKCQVCTKQFHVGCLLKWFKSSGNNTCPLCRQEFNFRIGS